MKKGLSLILALVLVLGFSGCEKSQRYFNAAVLEIGSGSVKVRCTEAFNSNIPVGAEIAVPTDVAAAEGAPELAPGDPIRVVFGGEVMESDPLQIGTVYAVYLLDAAGEVIPSG